ncbi:peptide ABC transporter substrate-binding protein [Bosea sp. BIWAKO-01]|uniref:peptide ABC transporter substrate-binding protein n=1 Tax=Bosea sp. BIWAKO-01 TaxID=506668 RepID=UPI00086E1976|nr:peptide ABC transporter substrate-binding protein [Bosea sp. BIWAKO-01]GAU84465.1 oligopeptide ABC transporter periplasmic oligopeptide-binding protein OppA [Bosea sp. BIWAKO-01]
MIKHSDGTTRSAFPMPALHRRQFLALGAGGFLAASGFGASAQTKPAPPPPAKPTGQVVVGLSQEPTAFNPLMPGIEVDETVWMQVFNTMWLADPQGNLMPDLATEVPSEANGGISEGGLAWKVKLREGVTWHDGTPFTAEDVKYTLELINAPGFKARTRVGHALVKDIVVKGPHEISWRMEKAYAPYLALLSNTFIVPKHLLEKASDPNTAPFNGAPVGTGPFKWGQRTPGDNITLVANERYHGKGPYLEKAVLKYVPDQTALYAQFRTGQVDLIIGTGIPANFYAEAVKLPGRKIVKIPNASLEILMPNLEHPALSEKAVRQALYASINKQAIIDVIFYGLHKPTESFAPQESWAYNPNLPQQSYDLAKANKLLDDAGWKRSGSGVRMKNGVPLEFAVSTTTGASLREQCQQLMMQDWQQVGVKMTINNMPAAVIWGEFYTRSKFQSLLVGTAFRTVIDPDPASRFASDAIPAKNGSGANQMQWQNAEADALMKEGQETFDQAKRKAIYWKLQEIVREELPILPIYQYVPVEGYKEGLIGYEPNINARQNTWNMGSWYWAR